MMHPFYKKVTFPLRYWLHSCIWFTRSCSLVLLLAIYLVACSAPGTSPISSRTPRFTPTAAIPIISTALVTYRGHTDDVVAIAWSPDSKRIASCGNDGTVQVWEAQTGKKLWQASVSPLAFAVAWSPDGKRIAAGGSSGEIVILDATTGKRQTTYASHNNAIEGLTWSPDSQYVASGSSDRTAKVWDVRTGKLLLTYTGHKDAVGQVAWSPDGRRIASASHDRTVQVWDARSGHRLLTYTGHSAPVWSVAWSPDGRRIISGTGTQGSYEPVTENNSVKVWDSTTGQTLLTYRQQLGEVYGVAWSPDGRYIASGGDDHIVHVWNATTGRTILLYRGHTSPILYVAWSPDGTLVASGSVDDTVQVWRP